MKGELLAPAWLCDWHLRSVPSGGRKNYFSRKLAAAGWQLQMLIRAAANLGSSSKAVIGITDLSFFLALSMALKFHGIQGLWEAPLAADF